MSFLARSLAAAAALQLLAGGAVAQTPPPKAAPVKAAAPVKPGAKPAVKAPPKPLKAKPADKAAVDKAAAPATDAAVEASAAEASAAPAPTAAVEAAAPAATADAVAVDATAAAAAAPAPAAAPTLPAAPPSAPVDASSQLVAVLDLKAGETAKAQASALTTMLTAEVSAHRGYRAVSRNELQALLTHQSTAQLVGCEEPRCMADIAQLASADYVVSGTVEKLEGATVVGLTLMHAGDDSTGATIVSRQKAAWRGSDDELLLVMRPLVQRLFDAQNAHSHVGNVEVFVPEGARVVLDDKDLGTAPTAAIRDLPTGVHRLQIQKDGYANEVVDLVVSRNETTIVRVDLEEIPLLEQPWFWAAAGGVALVAAGTAAGITTYALVTATPPPSRVVLGVKE